MIVRTWHGCVPVEHAEDFANHLLKLVLHIQRGHQEIWGHMYAERRRVNGSISSWQLTGKILRQ